MLVALTCNCFLHFFLVFSYNYHVAILLNLNKFFLGVGIHNTKIQTAHTYSKLMYLDKHIQTTFSHKILLFLIFRNATKMQSLLLLSNTSKINFHSNTMLYNRFDKQFLQLFQAYYDKQQGEIISYIASYTKVLSIARLCK